MKILEACRWAEENLRELEFPRLEADLLMCHLMHWERRDIYLKHANEISESSLEQYKKMVIRRKNREPLQYITGEVDFLGRSFITGKGALIARPETEFLTEQFIKELVSPEYILDVGTGSGVIAASLALEFPDAAVIATDISRDALAVSRKNKELFALDNLIFLRADLLRAFRQNSGVFDGVIANLPYIPSCQIRNLEPEVREGDPRVALDGGADGLDLVSLLIGSLPGILKRDGVLALELDSMQVGTISELLKNNPRWKEVIPLLDLTGRSRIIIARAT